MSVTIKWKAGSAPDDPERAVLPCIVFISADHPKFADYGVAGFGLRAGWWRWYIGLNVLWMPI